MGIPPFKMPTLNKETLRAEDSMRDGYRPKMLLYLLDELFYIYVQVKNSRRADDKLLLAYEILCALVRVHRTADNGGQGHGPLASQAPPLHLVVEY